MDATKFDGSRYLTSTKGKQYLPVSARLLWLRTEHPDAAVETELVTFTAEIAIVKASGRLPNCGSATGVFVILQWPRSRVGNGPPPLIKPRILLEELEPVGERGAEEKSNGGTVRGDSAGV